MAEPEDGTGVPEPPIVIPPKSAPSITVPQIDFDAVPTVDLAQVRESQDDS